MTINHPLQWSKETLEAEWQKIRDEDVLEDIELADDEEYGHEDQLSEDDVNRETDDRFKERWGYDYITLLNKAK